MWPHEGSVEPCRRVLAVAADPERAQRLRGALTDLEVVVEARLDLAVEALRLRPFEVLVIDLPVSAEAGWNTSLRAQMLASRLPIVLLSAQPDETLARQVVEAGVQEYVVADAGVPADLSWRLRQAAVRHRQLRRCRQATAWTATDMETGLLQGVVFERKLQDTLAFAGRLRERPALVLLGLGDLGAARELGVAEGQALLREIGRRLTWCVRRADSLGRLADAELGVLLPSAGSPAVIRMVAERIRLAAAAPYECGGASVRLRPSVGAAWYGLDGTTAGELLEAARGALAEAATKDVSRCQIFRAGDLSPWPSGLGRILPLAPDRRAEQELPAGAQP
ncbi:MAG TPA: diguanylate cyclase [Thermoanaerobaculia bacterium]|nr:diguanylate cyclase [Thermoanaerobaculia bacterium]